MNNKLLLAMLFIASIAFSQIPTNYVAEYNFKGNLIDNVSGTAMTASNATINALQYVNDRGAQTNSAVQINTGGSNGGGALHGYQFKSASNTISFWFKNTVSNQHIITAVNAGSTAGFRINSAGQGQLQVGVGTNNTWATHIVNVPAIFDNNWHHITLVMFKVPPNNGYSNTVYLDGTINNSLTSALGLANSVAMFGNSTNTRATLQISPVGSAPYTGGLDDILIYDRALTRQEVTAIYNNDPNPKTVYVNGSANGTGNGDSWPNAFNNLQDALAYANSHDEIWIAKGTYLPASGFGNEYISFNVQKPNVKIYGGFAGTETTLAQRDITLLHTTNETILSGDLAANDDTNITFNNATREDNSYSVVHIIRKDILLDGLTIANGYADATQGRGRNGAGISTEQFTTVKYPTMLTFKNCVIKDNVAWWGAGMYAPSIDGSSITIDACIFENNLSSNVGSAFDIVPLQDQNITVSITNSLFNGNRTEDNLTLNRRALGAPAGSLRAHFSNSNISATIVNNTFVNNRAEGTGAGTDFPTLEIGKHLGGYINTIVANNIFWGNTTNTGATTKAIGRANISYGIAGSNVFNCIDEDNFSNMTPAPASVSATNPNLDTDFKLQASSTNAIDTGDNSKLPTTFTTDLAGNHRIFNTTVDIGAYEYGSATASINDEVFNNTINMYPNPVSSTLHIATKETIKKIEIYTVLGRKILQTTKQDINVSNLTNGMYIVKIQSTDAKIAIKKFVKK